MKRRQLLQTAASVGLLGPASLISAATTLPKTPRDFEGPFYPTSDRNKSSDLIVGTPRDKVLLLGGRVLDQYGEPLRGCLVDIWQTDPQGLYNHPRDRRRGERWDDFLYFGESVTNEDGRFHFRTYVPGSYPNRPAEHIHYKIWQNQNELLTSQIYFEELGGSRGMARSDAKAHLQTVQLVPTADEHLNAEIDIVV